MYEIVGKTISIEKALNYYCGIKLNNRFCKCPLHQEKTGSFQYFKVTNSFYCHGCKKSGDVIKFVAFLFGISNFEALKKINYDFNLGFKINGKISTENIKKYHKFKQELLEREKKKELYLEKKWHLDRVIREYEKLCEQYQPKQGEPISKLFMFLKVNFENYWDYRIRKYGYK